MSRVPPPGMSLLTYLILFVVAAYLFKVNPVLCVGLVGAVVFFKVRGFFGGRHSRGQTRDSSAASQAALVAMCIALQDRSERRDLTPMNQKVDNSGPDYDPLEGLFLD